MLEFKEAEARGGRYRDVMYESMWMLKAGLHACTGALEGGGFRGVRLIAHAQARYHLWFCKCITVVPILLIAVLPMQASYSLSESKCGAVGGN